MKKTILISVAIVILLTVSCQTKVNISNLEQDDTLSYSIDSKTTEGKDCEVVENTAINDKKMKIIMDNDQDRDETVNEDESQIKSETENNSLKLSSSNYIVINGALLGSYENNKWNSLQTHEPSMVNLNMIDDIDNVRFKRKISTNEVIDEKYYVYNQSKLLASTNDFWGEDEDISKEDINEDFEPSFITYYFKDNGIIITDAILGLTKKDINPIPKNSISYIDPTQEHIDAVRTVLDNHKLTSTNVNISDVITIDMDNNGKVEELIIAQTPFTDLSYSDLRPEDRLVDGKGVYSIALLKKESTITPIYYQGYALSDLEFNSDDTLIPYGIDSQFRVKVLGFFDLNGDGLVEICLQNILWDIPEIRVYSFDSESNIKEVLYGNFAW